MAQGIFSSKIYKDAIIKYASDEPRTLKYIAEKIAEEYPEKFKLKELASTKYNITGIQQIAGEIGSSIHTNESFRQGIEVYNDTRPKTVRFVEVKEEDLDNESTYDRQEIIEAGKQELSSVDSYRESEFYSIAKAMKLSCGISFAVDHVKALANKELPGNHHPDNMQILEASENGRKSSSNRIRMTWEQQKDHILLVYKAMLVCRNVGEESSIYVDNSEVLEKLLERLHLVY